MESAVGREKSFAKSRISGPFLRTPLLEDTWFPAMAVTMLTRAPLEIGMMPAICGTIKPRAHCTMIVGQTILP